MNLKKSIPALVLILLLSSCGNVAPIVKSEPTLVKYEVGHNQNIDKPLNIHYEIKESKEK